MADIKSFTIIGDRARFLFRLSISNIRYVGMHNLTLANNNNNNNPQVNVRNVQAFLMENCTLSKTSGYSVGLYFSASTMNRVVGSTFVMVSTDARSRSTLLVNGSRVFKCKWYMH